MQRLQARHAETTLPVSEETDPLTLLAIDFEKLDHEIRSLYKAPLPPAIIHQICRAAREQQTIGQMMLDDCQLRAANRTLNDTHLKNLKRWLAGVRRFIEQRQTTYSASIRRKFYLIK